MKTDVFYNREEAGGRNIQLIPSIYTRHSAVHISDSILKKKKERCVLDQPHFTKAETEVQSVSSLPEVTVFSFSPLCQQQQQQKFLIKASCETLNP